MMDGIQNRLTLGLWALMATAANGFAHQIQNGSFESGINPPAPQTPLRVSADPGTPNLTEPQSDQPFRPPFLGPPGWSGLANPNSARSQNPSRSQGSSQQAPLMQPPTATNAGHGGGGGGGTGGGGNGSRGNSPDNSQPHPLQTLLAETTTPLYPDSGTNASIGTNDTDGTGTPGTTGDNGVRERDPIWVASLRGSAPASMLGNPGDGNPGAAPFSPQSLTSSSVSDIAGDSQSSDDSKSDVIPNPAPPGVLLGLMAVGTLAIRYRRTR